MITGYTEQDRKCIKKFYIHYIFSVNGFVGVVVFTTYIFLM